MTKTKLLNRYRKWKQNEKLIQNMMKNYLH